MEPKNKSAKEKRLDTLQAMKIAKSRKGDLDTYIKLTRERDRKYPSQFFALNNYNTSYKFKSDAEQREYTDYVSKIRDLKKSIEGNNYGLFQKILNQYKNLVTDPNKFDDDYEKLRIQVDKDIDKSNKKSDKPSVSKDIDTKNSDDVLTPEEEFEFDRLDNMGIYTADEIWKMVKKESVNSKDVLQLVIDHFGVVDLPYHGPTFILPSGYFLDLRNANHHSDVEKYLIDNGLSNHEYIVTGGSPTMMDLGCIRCDYEKYYIEVSDTPQPKRAQYDSLLIWLDMLSASTSMVQVMCRNGKISKTYKFDEYSSDEIVEKVKRYYSFGRLDEGLLGVKYPRNKVGESIVKINTPNKYNSNRGQRVSKLSEATRNELISKSRADAKSRYNGRLHYRPVTFDGVNIRELFTNDDLVFTTNVGDYVVTLAVKNVLDTLKSKVKSQGKCTYADVLKSVNECLDKDGLRINCTCADFTYRFKYWAYKGGYLYGDPGKAAEFPKKTNPNDSLGSMCKHIASVLTNKVWILKVSAAVNNYIRLNKDKCYPYLGLEVPQKSQSIKVDKSQDEVPQDTKDTQEPVTQSDEKSDDQVVQEPIEKPDGEESSNDQVEAPNDESEPSEDDSLSALRRK